MVADVPCFMHLAALHDCSIGKYVAKRFANPLSTVDNEKHGLFDAETSIN